MSCYRTSTDDAPQARESHLFKGTEQPVKEYDCVLIYDEDLGVSARFVRSISWLMCMTVQTFTLEKIDSFMNFSYDRKVQTTSSTIQRDMASRKHSSPSQTSLTH